jgi:predicted RNA-binding Zn-ribbon protein involved in translation (DUF1610 family)
VSHPDHHSVRRVQLPSGKTIEVVYFDDVAPVRTPATPVPADEGLHVCPCCGAEVVHPVAWREAGPSHWEMTLRCPNCEWLGSGIFAQEPVERLEEELDAGTEALIGDLRRLTHANMEEELDLLTSALAGDHILPMDF